MNSSSNKALFMKEAVISIPRTSFASLNLPTITGVKMTQSDDMAPGSTTLVMSNCTSKINNTTNESRQKNESTEGSSQVENGFVPKKHRLKRKAKRLESKKSKKSKKVVYEVEQILDRCEFDNKSVHYFVKWKDWDSCYNTWEPVENLVDCEECLEDYMSRVCTPNDIPKEKVEELSASLVQPTRQTLDNLMRSLLCNGHLEYEVPREPDVLSKLHHILRLSEQDWNPELLTEMKNILMLRAMHIKRIQQLIDLKGWEEEINLAGGNCPPITVENEIDLEGRPSNFFYVNEYIPGEGITIPEEPPIGCRCKPCGVRSRCCGKLSGSMLAYDVNGVLRVSVGTPIYECNKRCLCPDDCINKVVQRGRQVQLSIFRTSNGCGWGVKALQDIKKGTFVCEYVGEVIDSEEAEKRGKKYDAEGQTYLFDLDYNDDKSPYTVDAAVYGNVSHFINHSCSPNLAVYVVWVNCLDPNLPKLALFAVRNIKCGEEITFDYMCEAFKNKNTKRNQTSNRKNCHFFASADKEKCSNAEDSDYRVTCKCGSVKCRKYLF